MLGNLGTEVCNVLRHLVVGGQVGLLGVIQRFVVGILFCLKYKGG